MMAENEAGQSSDEESLQKVFDDAMKLYDRVENGKEPTNSDTVQMAIRRAISKFEKATNLVSLSGMFSTNESVDELPTDTLQYLLLPMLIGNLTIKLMSKQRRELADVAEVYFRDFLQRCKDYGITDIEIPQHLSDDASDTSVAPRTEKDRIVHLVQSREAKIKRYKEIKELHEKLESLKKAMDSPTVEDGDKREYFLTTLRSYIQESVDALDSLQQEKPMLDYMAKHATEPGAKEKPRERPPPLRPVIITRDAVQKAVYGLGYPSLPTMTIEEFYDKRVRDGIFPSAANIPHKTIGSTEQDPDEADQVKRERMAEEDDPEELARQRNMDEYKDDHRRGWGNRHNRS